MCVVHKAPLPATSGSRLRLLHLLRALDSAGDLTILVGSALSAQERHLLAEELPSALIEEVPITAPSGAAGLAQRVRNARTPGELAPLDTRALSTRVAELLPAADLVWCFEPQSAIALPPGALQTIPVLVDLPDLRHVWLDRATAVGMSRRRSAADEPGWRTKLELLRQRLDHKLWVREYKRLAAKTSTLIVCSAIDARRLHQITGHPRIEVVPNGFDAAGEPSARPAHGTPVFLFAGSMAYAPNADGAAWFADRVFPLIRGELPDARLVIAGRSTAAVDGLARRPGVTVTGFLPSMEPVLAEADVAVVPLRVGTGTRLKILEAFSQAIPVVSTSVGAEGLDVEDGLHVRLADDPEAFSKACVDLARDEEQRAKLTSAAAELFERRYRWPIIERDFTSLVGDLIDH